MLIVSNRAIYTTKCKKRLWVLRVSCNSSYNLESTNLQYAEPTTLQPYNLQPQLLFLHLMEGQWLWKTSGGFHTLLVLEPTECSTSAKLNKHSAPSRPQPAFRNIYKQQRQQNRFPNFPVQNQKNLVIKPKIKLQQFRSTQKNISSNYGYDQTLSSIFKP